LFFHLIVLIFCLEMRTDRLVLVLCTVAACAALCVARRDRVGAIVSTDLFNVMWTYNNSYASTKDLAGPKDWKKYWGMCDADIEGASQSPINIDTTQVPIAHAGVLPVTFQSAACDTFVRNIGSTLSVMPSDPSKCTVGFTTASGTKYKFFEAHLHWHKYYNHRGTEHKVDGQGEAVEAQLIHYDSKFASIDQAFQDGEVGNIAVLAVRYTVAPTAENATEVLSLNQVIVDPFDQTQYMDLSMNGKANIGQFSPYDLIGNALPRTNLPMFQYNGSLTTPSCDAITSWYIVQQTVMLSQSQMHQLRFFEHVNKSAAENNLLGFEINDNIRPVVPLNGRRVVAYPFLVETNFSSDSAPDDSSSQPKGHHGLSTGAIVGISIGVGVIVFGAIAAAIIIAINKKGRSGYEGINA